MRFGKNKDQGVSFKFHPEKSVGFQRWPSSDVANDKESVTQQPSLYAKWRTVPDFVIDSAVSSWIKWIVFMPASRRRYNHWTMNDFKAGFSMGNLWIVSAMLYLQTYWKQLTNRLPNKSSPRDVLPTSLLKSCADVFSPGIVNLANISLRTGEFPST